MSTLYHYNAYLRCRLVLKELNSLSVPHLFVFSNSYYILLGQFINFSYQIYYGISSFLQVMHNIFPDNVYTDGNSFRCFARMVPILIMAVHFLASPNWIHLIERMPSMEKKGFVVLLFLLWDCPSFLGHRLWWMLECVNEFPVNSSLCVSGSRLCHTHTVCTICSAPPQLPFEGEFWDCWLCQITVCWRRMWKTFEFV